MYPNTFRPTTTCTVVDGYGHTANSVLLQLFKPLLGYSTNGPQPRIPNLSLPNQAGAILRGLFQLAPATTLTIKPGPKWWSTGNQAYIRLDEDPLTEAWDILDAVPWLNQAGTSQIWSFFAAKAYVAPTPPAPPAKVVGGLTSPAAMLVTLNSAISAVVAPGTTQWFYAPNATGQPASVTAAIGQSLTNGIYLLGNTLAAPAYEAGGVFGAGAAAVAGASHVGPNSIMAVQNAGGTYQTSQVTLGNP